MKKSEIVISTAHVESRLRGDFWREVTRPFFLSSFADEVNPEASIRSRAFDTGTIALISFSAQQCRRDRKVVASSDLADYLVQLVVSGNVTGDFGEPSFRASRGDVFIIDLAKPYITLSDAGSRLSVAVPRERLEKMVGRRNLHGLTLKADWPFTRLLTDYMQGLFSVASGPISAEESSAAQDALVTLVAGNLSGKAPMLPGYPSELSVVLRERMLAYIDEHLRDADLGPQKLMTRFRISRAHLYRAFEEDGGISRLIREKRLDLAYRMLSVPSSNTSVDSIKRLGLECGFTSPENFSRAFRERFGTTPGQVRKGEAPTGVRGADQFDIQAYFTTFTNAD
ncbi:helix-turn-helix domain-containing protein [Burkholderia cepacia]|uniref:Helix-turn-helix domain-containing protein n=1 Tax=Burkholderia cepacia GG4 TaxID=1009846 RepID=A0A9W3JYJ7_BURCE|nr:helix-turn-helix domain-containing protein [Burkholderia cepacia]AFQ47699.1 helix-turn-helix domain-containing protein [Burkholderia cepacia GG4]